MALEASDMSDGAILEGTQQFQNGNGQIQFKTVLPSGRELESEWIQPDLKKRAMIQWLDVVKDQAILDADQARAEAREVAMKERQSAAQQAPAQTQETASTETSSTADYSPIKGAAAGAVATPATSPDDFVAAGLRAAQADYDHWNIVMMDAAQRLSTARHNIDKWTNIKRSLEGHEQSSSGIRNSDTGNSGAGDGTVRRRRKRIPKSTDGPAGSEYCAV